MVVEGLFLAAFLCASMRSVSVRMIVDDSLKEEQLAQTVLEVVLVKAQVCTFEEPG